MFRRCSLPILCVIFLVGCSSPFSHSDVTKTQLHQVVTKELQKTNRSFVLHQKMNNQENVFSGNQVGENWTLQHKTKPFRIAKTGNKIEMSVGKKKETLSADQFGIISPIEHLKLVDVSGNRIRKLPSTMINSKKVNHISVTVNKNALARILKDRLRISSSADVAPYLSGNMRVTYELFYLPTNELIKFKTNITSFGDDKEACDLTYLF